MTFDPLVEERVAPGVVVGRSGNGNPLIVPRGEVALVEYDRASNLADYLVKDIFGIKTWEKRLLLEAAAKNPDITALAAVEGYNTGLGLVQPLLSPDENKASGRRLDELIARLEDRIGMHEKANMGTVAHAATEPGFTGVVHPLVQDAVNAIHELSAGLEIIATEVFVANDELRSAGTFDHAYYIADQALARELGEVFSKTCGFEVDLTGALIGDKKTGKNCHIGEFEVQVGGTYAHGEVYLGPPILGDEDHPDGGKVVIDQRLTLEEYFGGPVNRTTGLLVHASTTGSPRPRVLPLDLQRGRDLASMAACVRDARNMMDKIGIPKKLDMSVLSKRVVEGEFEKLLASWDSATADPDGTVPTHLLADADQAHHHRATELYQRFKHVWPDEYTQQIKERLS